MRLVLFDMDHTLVPCDTGTLWAEYLVKNQLLSGEMAVRRKQFLIDYQAGTLDAAEAYRFEMKVLNELPEDKRVWLLNDFFATSIKPIIPAKAIAQVNYHRQQGDYIIIITATLEEIARPIAEFFGVDFLIGGQGVLDEHGKYTGEIVLEPCMGRGKLVHLENWLTISNNNPQYYIFYSDSHNDLPLLEQVDEAIAVDPDEQLQQIAQANSWSIISFIN